MATAVEVCERPILMSGEMVRAILDGRKTQTRRVVKPQPEHGLMPCHWCDKGWGTVTEPNEYGMQGCMCDGVRCPYGFPGDHLYVRETWRPFGRHRDGHWEGGLEYRVGGQLRITEPQQLTAIRQRHKLGQVSKWKPSIHMPKWASRIWLQVTGVRAERVQDITTEDVWSEGVQIPSTEDGKPLVRLARHDGSPGAAAFFTKGRLFPGQPPLTEDELARAYFAELWESLNAKRGYSWDSNPWVWVVEFTGLSAGGE